MSSERVKVRVYGLGLAALMALAQAIAAPRPAGQAAAQKVRPIGVVAGIQQDQLKLKTDSGPVLTIPLPDDVSVLRVPPGAKTLKGAAKISVSDVNVGDRVLVLGYGESSAAKITVIDMSKASLAVAHQAQEQEWERRGISGVVKSINPADKSLVLAVQNTPPTPGNPTHQVTVTLQSNAKVLRYAPDSVKFSDARPAQFADIKVDDQVRALGEKSADGASFKAEELVSGTFLNIPATVISVDAAKGTIMVNDLSTKKPVLVHTNSESKMHTLPTFIAYMIARFNSGGEGGPNGAGGPGANGGGSHGAEGFRGRGGAGGSQASGRPEGAKGQSGQGQEGRGGFEPMGGHMPSFNQMLERTPPLSLSSLKAGQALIVVSTEGTKPGEVTAIDVLAGVEPILEARPKGSQNVQLGPWNMSTGGSGGGEGQGMGGGMGQGGGGGGM